LLLGLGLLASLASGQARGDILITLAGTAPSGTNTAYTYNVFLTPGFELDKAGVKGNTSTGDLFTVYDFVGLVGSPTISPALSTNGFSTFSIKNTGTTPVNTAPNDNSALANVTFKYTKSTETNNPAAGMNLLLGQFTLTSTFGPAGTANIQYATATQKNLPGSSEDEHLANNVSEVVGPAAVPEPPSLLLFGIALPLAGGFLLLRRRLPILANT
jgi:hypothetical protein